MHAADLLDVTKACAPREPRGWGLLARLGALPGRTCSVCDLPAIVGTPHGFRCSRHPPRWGARLNWTPRGTPCVGVRCYCGRCPTYRIASYGSVNQPGTTDLKKQRVALGGVHAQREAVEGRRRGPGPDVPPEPPTPLRSRPATGAGHPSTSHRAADRLHGLPVGRIRLDVFRAIRSEGSHGMTDDEVEVRLGRPHQTVSSARNALVTAGYVEPALSRQGAPVLRPTRSGSPATVWVVSAPASLLPR